MKGSSFLLLLQIFFILYSQHSIIAFDSKWQCENIICVNTFVIYSSVLVHRNFVFSCHGSWLAVASTLLFSQERVRGI